MKVDYTEPLVLCQSEVWRRLSDSDSWPTWMKGLRSAVAREKEVELHFASPPDLRLLVEVECGDDVLRFRLIEGDVSALEGSVEIVSRGEGALLHWQQEMMVPTNIPFPLRVEFESVILPDWIRCLVGGEIKAGSGA